MRLDCGIKRSRLATWLDEELRLPRDEDGWVFQFGGGTCRIELNPLQDRTLGCVSIERTELAAEGDGVAVSELSRLFTLRFASAGG